MKLVVGLGNPGRRYARTRHNVGFRILERLAARHGIELDRERFGGRYGVGWIAGREVGLLEPETYMNLSGAAVAAAVRGLRLDDVARDLLVLVDDVDLPFARLRLRPGGGSGGHQGLADVIERLGRRDFPRLRFGIGRPPPGMETADYVLSRFPADEERALDAALDRAADAAEVFLAEGIEAAMNRFNLPNG